MRQLVLVVLCSALACRPEPTGDGKSVGDDTRAPEKPENAKATPPPEAPAKPDPCGAAALGLGAARALDPWTLPSGCTPTGSRGKTIARTDAELAALVQCPAGVGVDFSKQAVLAVGYTLSPAGVGLGAFDDGKVVTLVSRQRNPCPNDPMPMPMNTTAWFVVPGGGERTFADKVCKVETTCN